MILSTFQGITVEQDTQLRRAVEAGRRPLSSREEHAGRTRRGRHAGRAGLLKNLTGTNSIAYTADRSRVALAKVLTKIAKDVPAFKFRAGVVEGRVLSIAEIQQLSLAALARKS